VTVHCTPCDGEYIVVDARRIRCPICDEPAAVVGGRELELAALEVIDVAADR